MEDGSSILPEELSIKRVDVRLSGLEVKITSIDKKVTQVVEALIGNPLTKGGGFTNEIEELKKKMQEYEGKQTKLEDFQKRFNWTIGIIVVIGSLIQFGISIYSNLVK